MLYASVRESPPDLGADLIALHAAAAAQSVAADAVVKDDLLAAAVPAHVAAAVFLVLLPLFLGALLLFRLGLLLGLGFLFFLALLFVLLLVRLFTLSTFSRLHGPYRFHFQAAAHVRNRPFYSRFVISHRPAPSLCNMIEAAKTDVRSDWTTLGLRFVPMQCSN